MDTRLLTQHQRSQPAISSTAVDKGRTPASTNAYRRAWHPPVYQTTLVSASPSCVPATCMHWRVRAATGIHRACHSARLDRLQRQADIHLRPVSAIPTRSHSQRGGGIPAARNAAHHVAL